MNGWSPTRGSRSATRSRSPPRPERTASASSSERSSGAPPTLRRWRAPSIACVCISTSCKQLGGIGDRVDRFAVAVAPGATDRALDAINARSFGFRAHRSRDVAAQSSRTFAVVSRFNRAIGVITIVASAIFLLCIMLLKVEERRRDVAALRLLGISRRTVTAAVVLEASCIALLGSAAGVAFGYVSGAIINWHYRGVYRTPLAFSIVTPQTVAFSVVLSLVLGIGAGFLAARRLTGVPPLSLFGR